MSWLKTTRDGILLSIHLSPRSKQDKIDGLYGDSLKIRIKAPPLDGKANAYLTGFIAKQLGTSKSNVTLVKGLSSKTKQVLVTGLSEVRIQKAFAISAN